MTLYDKEEADFIEQLLLKSPGARKKHEAYKTPYSQRLYKLDKTTIRCKWCGDWTHQKKRGTCNHCHDWGFPTIY